MSDAIDLSPTIDRARATWRTLEDAIARSSAGRAEARAALEQGRPVFAAAGLAGWFDSATVLLEQAAAGAALGGALGPIGAVVGGAVGAVVAALSQPAVGVATLRADCTLPDGSRTTVYNEPSGCLCFERWQPSTPAEEAAEYERWRTTDHPGFGYHLDRKRGLVSSTATDAELRAFWRSNRARTPIEREQIERECLPRYAERPETRAAAEQAFGGRWGDRWYWAEETLFGRRVGEIPRWVPVSQEVVTRWFLLAAGAGLGPVEVSRIGTLKDPRLGVARASQSLDELGTSARRAAIANACVLVLAASGGVVSAALGGLAKIEPLADRLGVSSLSDAEVRAAWVRLADPNVALLPEQTPARRSLPIVAAGVAAVALLIWLARRRRSRRG